MLSGGDLPHSVKLARADADAFVRRLSAPPVLDETPELRGTAYKIASTYWDDLLRNGRDDRGAAELEALYYEDGGYVGAKQDGREVWMVLDLRQRAIIDRYLALTRAGTLRDQPGVLEVLVVAARSEIIGVEIGGVPLTDEQRRSFWSLMLVGPRATHMDPPQVPLGARGVWMVFQLEEGRSLQVFYERQAGLFIDSFGAEMYSVSTPLAALIDGIVPRTTTGLAIEQQRSTGSYVWWVIAGGAGLACLGIAYWLSQRFSRTSA